MHGFQKWFGFLIIVVFVVAGISLGGSLAHFVNFPSLFIVGGFIVGGALASFPFQVINSNFQQYFANEKMDEMQSNKAHYFFSTLANHSLAGGLVGSLIGLVNMLANLDDPVTIGPAMAVALLCPFYGVLTGEVFFRSAAADCLSRSEIAMPHTNRGSSTLMFHMISLLLVLTAFFVMLLAFADFT
jgi:flagellar motor component MotA